MGFNIIKAIGGAITGFVTAGPAGAAAGAVVSGFARPSARAPAPLVLSPGVPRASAVHGYASADSVFVTKVPGLYERTRIYGPQAGISAISSYPVGGGINPPDGGPVGGGGAVQYMVPSCPMPVGRHGVAIMPSPCR